MEYFWYLNKDENFNIVVCCSTLAQIDTRLKSKEKELETVPLDYILNPLEVKIVIKLQDKMPKVLEDKISKYFLDNHNVKSIPLFTRLDTLFIPLLTPYTPNFNMSMSTFRERLLR